ncbi:hypothetical protein SmJEL517_g05260 [Synchytrium microbalum]|uniref:Uncharacterized protein n=1 Tax=Synchytrium microbalum TaxID=1806994 RepID=A0A507C021_9FUNG|nr:uncharacterized protein SmJEL517_g05260 [Synchytrium microbalum]TPX31394.1 hypothetical protein SmJEL517_g05260 [Synchytrium microbalum]
MSGRGRGRGRGGHSRRSDRDVANESGRVEDDIPVPKAFKLATQFLTLDTFLTTIGFVFAGFEAEAVKNNLDFIDFIRRSFIEWDSSIADLVLLSVARTVLVLIIGTALRRYPTARKLYAWRLAIYAVLALSTGFVILKLVQVIQTSGSSDKWIVTPGFMYTGVGAQLIFSLIEFGGALQFTKAWVLALDYKPIPNEDGTPNSSRRGSNSSRRGSKIDLPEPRRPIPWTRLLGLLAPDWYLMSIGMLMLLFNSATSLVVPYYVGLVVDLVSKAMGSHIPDELGTYMLELFFIFMLGGLTGMLRSYAFTVTGYNVVKRLRVNVFGAIIRQDISFFDSTKTGELISRLSSDTQMLQSALTVNVSMLVRSLVSVLGSVIILLSLSWKLTLHVLTASVRIMMMIVPAVVLAAILYGNAVGDLQDAFQSKLASAASVAQEVISQVRTVRAFAKEEYSLNQYSNAIEETQKVGKRIAVAQSIFMGAMSFLPQTSIALVLYFGVLLVIKGEITAGLLTSFLFYTLNLAMSFGTISSLFGDFMQSLGASSRIFDLQDRIPTIPVSGGEQPPSFDGRIEFKNVDFAYPSRPEAVVLKDFSLLLEPGKVCALVGPSGQGKSTVMSLTMRFYDVLAGSILVDGRDLRDLDPACYRKSVGYVSQEPVLFDGTIRENILYGWHKVQQPTEDEIIQAATQANAHDFIKNFPKGYSTLVGERGVTLSGGQRQRITIARSFLLNPRLLLLDEATSSLDAESEFLVQEAINRIMIGRTVLIIAHRLSTVRSADMIAVIEGGKLTEMGSHDTLMKHTNGAYRKLVNRQTDGFKLE